MLLKLLIACILVQIAAAGVVNVTLSRREGYSAKLLREGRLAEFRISRSVQQGMRKFQFGRAGRVSKADVARQPFYDYYTDDVYIGKINIGTPQQEFRVILDTQAANLWIPDLTCDNGNADCSPGCSTFGIFCVYYCDPKCCSGDDYGPCDDKAHYDSSKSSSYTADGRNWTIDYNGFSASGFLGVDTVALGDKGSTQISIPTTTFGQANTLPSFSTDGPYDGILGLGFRSIAEDDVQPVFQHAVELGLVDQNLFTIWLKGDGHDAEGHDVEGQITYGGFDTDHCETAITYFPLASKSSWEFNISGAEINGKKRSGKWTAISHTGSSSIFAPFEVFDDIINATRATYNFDYGLYAVDCSTKFTWTIYLDNNSYTIDEKSMLLKFYDVCLLAFEGAYEEEPDFTLGDLFIRANCQIYDFGNERVGFTKAISS